MKRRHARTASPPRSSGHQPPGSRARVTASVVTGASGGTRRDHRSCRGHPSPDAPSPARTGGSHGCAAGTSHRRTAMTTAPSTATPARAGTARPDRRHHRRQRGHRAGDSPPGPRRRGRGHPGRPAPGPAATGRGRSRRRRYRGLRRHRPGRTRAILRRAARAGRPRDAHRPGPDDAPLAELDRERAHRAFDDHQWLAVEVARLSAGRVRPGGTLLFMGGTACAAGGPACRSSRRPPPRCPP